MTEIEDETPETVRGVVVPLKWAEDGTVITVGISGYGERDFLISSPESLDLWISLLRKYGCYNGCVLGQNHSERLTGLKISRFDHNPHKVIHSGYAAVQA